LYVLMVSALVGWLRHTRELAKHEAGTDGLTGIPNRRAFVRKAELQIADLDRSYYQNHTLTIARHPSETDERMMVRVVAFALNAADDLSFAKGLSAEDEPDLWRKDLTGAITQWIEVGQPDEKRVRRACGRADQVMVVTYGGRVADMWWTQNSALLARNDNLTVLNLPYDETRALAAKTVRNMQLQCTLQEGELWFIIEGENLRVAPTVLQAPGN